MFWGSPHICLLLAVLHQTLCVPYPLRLTTIIKPSPYFHLNTQASAQIRVSTTSTQNYCYYGQFRCNNGQCVPRSYLCNVWRDCSDGSDEWNCRSLSYESIKPTQARVSMESTQNYCIYRQFRCNNGQCISRYDLCDGLRDCSDGSDEWNCWQSSYEPIKPTQVRVSTTSTQNYCHYWQFRCNNGQCIHRYQLCDGGRDCSDGSDEWNCRQSSYESIKPTQVRVSTTSIQNYCHYWQFRCNNGQCIHRYQLCNSWQDCSDGSDEWNCRQSSYESIKPTQARVFTTSTQNYCHYWQFRCNNGQCIHRYQLCNSWQDCSDGSDEWNCRQSSYESIKPTQVRVSTTSIQNYCHYWQFRCNNGQCIHRYQLCNSWQDCSDGSDEWNCRQSSYESIKPTQARVFTTSTQNYCHYGQFRCNNGQCVPRSYLCDGGRDCSDGSDEWNCRQSSYVPIKPTQARVSTTSIQNYCYYGQFRCNNGQCVPRSYLCNSWRDCSDGSDEWNCWQSSYASIKPTQARVSMTSTQSYCYYGQFRCNNGQCVPRSYLCDGWRDCSDGSDEWNCRQSSYESIKPTQARVSTTSTQNYCHYWQFRCNNGQCIHRYQLCNSWQDCSDGSDEWPVNCRVSSSLVRPSRTRAAVVTPSVSCPFRCRNGHCIAEREVCDGHFNCYDRSDERDSLCRVDVRLKGPHDHRGIGRVEVYSYYKKTWGTVCDNYWSDNDATVVCRQLGYEHGVAMQGQYDVPSGSGLILLDDVQCDGWEPSISHCRHSPLGHNDCSHWEDAGVKCFVSGDSSTSPKAMSMESSYKPIMPSRTTDTSSAEFYIVSTRTAGSFYTPATIAPQMSSSMAPTASYCYHWQFRCNNGQCISKNKVCNGQRDCSDGSDEWTCEDLTKCQNKVDLAFILDMSSSVLKTGFQRMRTFVKDLSAFFDISFDGKTRVSLMTFSDQTTIHIPFSQTFKSKLNFGFGVDKINYIGGGTATAMALKSALSDMFTKKNGARGAEAKKVLIILTDGRSNNELVSGPAEQLRNAGVVIFSLGIGPSVLMTELYIMASEPKERHVSQLTLSDSSDRHSPLAKRWFFEICNASSLVVVCDSNSIHVAFKRVDLPQHVNIDRLHLRDRDCKASSNDTHVFFTLQRSQECGTIYETTDEQQSYTNSLLEEKMSSSSQSGTDDYVFFTNFTCTYDRWKTVGSLKFLPSRQMLSVSRSDVGKMVLSMNLFKTDAFNVAYAIDDYPVHQNFSESIYIQYSVRTSHLEAVVRAMSCRATPTNKPYDSPQYVFIANGCDNDTTIHHYNNGSHHVQRFSIKPFSFLGQHQFVYIHCDLVVCSKKFKNSICVGHNSCSTSLKLSPSDDNSPKYTLSFGPVMYPKHSNPGKRSDSSKSNTVLTDSLIAVSCLATILALAFICVWKRDRIRRLYIRVESQELLTMDDVAYVMT